MTRLLPQPLTSAFLLVIWVLAHNALTPGVLLLGAVLAIAIPALTSRFWPEYPARLRYGALLRLVLVVLADIVIANLRVAVLILGPRSRLRPTFFQVPVSLDGPYPLTLLASIISLTPGTVSADVSPAGDAILVHGLDVADVPGTVARIQQRYEAGLREVFR